MEFVIRKCFSFIYTKITEIFLQNEIGVSHFGRMQYTSNLIKIITEPSRKFTQDTKYYRKYSIDKLIATNTINTIAIMHAIPDQ